MKKKKNPMINIYNINLETNNYMIEISLDNYAELFNGWDASPLRRRDLEPELLDYIERCGEEIPKINGIELYLYLPAILHEEEKEARSKAGITANFQMVLFLIHKLLRKLYRQILMNIVMSTLFLSAAYFLRNVVIVKDMFLQIFVEGLYIGGWVLLWEAFSIFFFNSHEVRERRRMYLRFIKMPIYFKYITTQPKDYSKL